MKIALTILAVCVAACLADTASNSTLREKRQSQKPGRFLSLPIPAKCASRKFQISRLPISSKNIIFEFN